MRRESGCVQGAFGIDVGSSFGAPNRFFRKVDEAVAHQCTDPLRSPRHAALQSFDFQYAASLGAEDLTVHNITRGYAVSVSALSIAHEPSTNTAVLAFPGLSSGRLDEGNYRATLCGDGVTDARAVPLDGDGDGTPGGDYRADFFYQAADANRDRVVDITDLGILATNWQGTDKTFSQGDFNYDGIVDITDLGILATHWQKTLVAPGQLQASPTCSGLLLRSPFELNPAPTSARDSLVEDIDLTATLVG